MKLQLRSLLEMPDDKLEQTAFLTEIKEEATDDGYKETTSQVAATPRVSIPEIDMRDALTCATCEVKFKSQWLLDAHQKGHDDALVWCRELQRTKLQEVGLDIDDLEDYSHLYGGSDDSDESESEPEAEDFNFDFSAVKTEINAEQMKSTPASEEDREDKYDPMNFSDDEPVTGNNAETESIPEMSENEDDEDDGPPPLELAGPPELEEIPPHHQEMQPLDDLLNVPFTPPADRKRPKRKLRIPARARKYTSDDDYQPDEKDEEYDPGVENSPPIKTPRKSYAQAARSYPNTAIPDSEGMVDLALHPVSDNLPEPMTPSKVDRSEYANGEPKKCKYCDKEFRSFAQLDQHQRCHTGEKPYLCVHCHKTFRQKAHLTTHVRIHTGARPYQCKVCGKGFIQSQHLKNHTRLHTGEKPFQCKVCKKFFSQISNLRHHERGHKRKGEYFSGSDDEYKKEKEEPPQVYTPSPRQALKRRAAAIAPRPDSPESNASEEPEKEPELASEEMPVTIDLPLKEVPSKEAGVPSMDSLEMSAFDEDPMDTSVPQIGLKTA